MVAIPALWDINDVSRALKVSPHTVRRWASKGTLQRVKLGTRTLFDPADVARFVDEARSSAADKTETKTRDADEIARIQREGLPSLGKRKKAAVVAGVEVLAVTDEDIEK